MFKFVNRRNIFIALVTIFLAVGIFVFFAFQKDEVVVIAPAIEIINPKYEIIGQSVEGRKIEAFTFGVGEDHLLFVGGIHGGYEWNSILLAYKIIDFLEENKESISKNLAISIVPNVNPDGLFKVINKEGRFVSSDIAKNSDTAPGRFNANGVDLNRNFPCKWSPVGTWRGKVVSTGSGAFSEPETKAIRDFVLEKKPVGVVFWHSQAKAVYASECEKGILPMTLDMMNIYAKASGYNPLKTFDNYVVTGAVEDWLASIDIPAITVELENHNDLDLEQNLAGFKALLEYYKDSVKEI